MSIKNNSEEEQTGNILDDLTNVKQNFQLKVKFEVYGEEILEKIVKCSGNSGRVYLPLNWVGSKVKVIRKD